MKKHVFLLIILIASIMSQGQKLIQRTEYHGRMGSNFEVTIFAPSDSLIDLGVKTALDEAARIEMSLSEFIPGTEVWQVNQNAGINPVKVSKELFELTRRCLKVSALTDGAFDISWCAASKLWHFDSTLTKVPTQAQIDSILPMVNYQNIELNEAKQTIFLKKRGMKIGFGAVGKGYAVKKCKEAMIRIGIENAMVKAGGDLITWGKMGDVPWTIGIANPNDKKTIFSWLQIGETAISTSGDYEHFVIIDSVRYSHIINPKTGYPARGVRSATILCPDSELSDALSTSVFVLGVDRALGLINQLNGVNCILFDESNAIHNSKGLSLNYYQPEEIRKKHSLIIGKQ
jgi:thiamine biosynthesis lipoprotein